MNPKVLAVARRARGDAAPARGVRHVSTAGICMAAEDTWQARTPFASAAEDTTKHARRSRRRPKTRRSTHAARVGGRRHDEARTPFASALEALDGGGGGGGGGWFGGKGSDQTHHHHGFSRFYSCLLPVEPSFGLLSPVARQRVRRRGGSSLG